ncbi:MAG TPA: cytochrome P450 [Candidatus Dormibacteraeota bacterium]|nr:cytochrome P450 [Candidatus Dormibacteraeota bacterium]
MADVVSFNIWDPEFRANPYPHYGALLAGPPPVITVGPMTFALVARYADVTAGLRDHEHMSSVGPPPPPQAYQGRFSGARNMLGSDQPRHSFLRKMVSRDFTPRRIREMEPRIREIAKDLLDKVEAKGDFDLMADLANVLPVTVIAEMLGVPAELHATFKQWSDTLVGGDNNVPGAPPPPKTIRVVDELGDYFSAEIEKRRINPGPDLVSALVAAHDEGDAMSAADLLSFVTLLLIAGNETTTNLIGNGTLALGRNPEQFDALKRNPAMLPRAIEEMLRYDGPVQATVRFTNQPVQLGGTELPAKAFALMIVAAANRDPAQFKDPEKFDITRDPNDHVAFGEGIHFCIGAALARMEATVAFEAMLARFPRLRLKDPAIKPTYKGSYFLRGLETLPLAID